MNTLLARDVKLPIDSKTIVVGILNVTPDSFYDGGRYSDIDKAIEHCERLIEDGSDIIDIGGESTRPGSKSINMKEEYDRVIPVIKIIKKRFDIVLSIDTTKNAIAKEALENGVEFVNDVSGLAFDPEISDTVARYKGGIILSHTTSRPIDMQLKTSYENFMEDVYSYLSRSIISAENSGINKNSIVIDPGFGFGKELKHNLLLLKHLDFFKSLNKPIMTGTSMKSFIGRLSDIDDIYGRHDGTIASVVIAVMNGASIVRVHKVKEVKRAIDIVDAVKYMN